MLPPSITEPCFPVSVSHPPFCPQRGEPSAPAFSFHGSLGNVPLLPTSLGYTVTHYAFIFLLKNKIQTQLPLRFPTGNFKPSPVVSPFNYHHSSEKIPINLRKQSQFPFSSTQTISSSFSSNVLSSHIFFEKSGFSLLSKWITPYVLLNSLQLHWGAICTLELFR